MPAEPCTQGSFPGGPWGALDGRTTPKKMMWPRGYGNVQFAKSSALYVFENKGYVGVFGRCNLRQSVRA